MLGPETSRRFGGIRERRIEIPPVDHGVLAVMDAAKGGQRPLKVLDRLPRRWIPGRP
jgi:hypothetical protein